MKDEVIIPKQWEDIVFENRNKEYGAYLIRKVYSGNLTASVIITLAVLGLTFAYPSIMQFFKSSEDGHIVEHVKQLTVNLEQPPPITPNQPPPPKLDIPPPVKTIIKFLPPKVTDKQVIEEEQMPTMEEVKQTDTGNENLEGTGEVIFEEPVAEAIKEDGDADKIFTVVEQPPEYQGGLEAMYKFVQKNMKYPAQARRMGIEGSVFVSFVVDAEGKISEVQAIKGIGSGCDQEAMRVIQTMPNWKPGKQSGKPVKVRFVMPLKFKLG